jgi:hypothetical protein
VREKHARQVEAEGAGVLHPFGPDREMEHAAVDAGEKLPIDEPDTVRASATSATASSMETAREDEEEVDGVTDNTGPKKCRRGRCHARALPPPPRPARKGKPQKHRLTAPSPATMAGQERQYMYQIRTSEAGSYGRLFRGHRKSFRHSLDQWSTGKELERPTPDLDRRSGGSSSACRRTTAAAAATPTLHLNYGGQTSLPLFSTGSTGKRASVRRAPAGSSFFL